MKGLQLIATGGALPGRTVTNEDLSRMVDTSDEWIASRTGIRTRHWCTDEESAATLAVRAAKQALERSGLAPADIACCICATLSAPDATPSVACQVQAALGLPEDRPALDVNAACSGFLYGMGVARGLLATLGGQYALVIGCEALSRLMDPADRSTCVLFGDGAGAAIFRSTGNSAVSMRVSVIVNAINFCGNAFCVFVLRMGVAGVAVPTLVSRAVGAVIILALAARPDYVLCITPQSVTRLEGRTVRSILHIGIPSAFENSLFQLGRVLVVSMISLFGTVHISANAVANNLDAIGCIVGNAMGLAMITVIGRCVGAQDFDQTRYYTKKLLVWAYIAMGVFNGAILLFLPQVVGIYALSGATMQLAILLVQIHAGFAILLWPASFVLPNALRAANDVRFTMVVATASMLVWRMGLSWILCVNMGMGAVGVWIAMIVDWVCRILCFVARFVSGAWQKNAASGIIIRTGIWSGNC